jgi:tRNA pseudouridine38-40 synthase
MITTPIPDSQPRALALAMEYDGTNYAGWQRQPNGVTIQELVENACFDVFGVPCTVVGSGRTDSGVHARLQVAHVHVHNGNAVPVERVALALNANLPRDVNIRDVQDVEHTFHARYSPIWREYVYLLTHQHSVFTHRFHHLLPRSCNVERLETALDVFVGDHDFSTFSKHNPDTRSYRCNVLCCRLESHTTHLLIRLRANRFVYGMCRTIVGAALDAARGAVSPAELQAAMAQKCRAHQRPLAPAHALILNRVTYPTAIFDHLSTY